MENVTNTKMNLIRSRALVALFGMLLGALLLLPIISSASNGKKPGSSTKLYIQALQKNKHAAIIINSLDNDNFTLTIESDSKGSVYYDKAIKNLDTFAKIFDFSNLEDGSFTIKIKSRKEEKTREFEIENGKIKVFYKETVKPEFTVTGEKASLKFSNSAKLEYSIKVFNAEGEELSSAKESKKNINKIFDFSTAKEGDYKIIASSGKNSFSFNYTK